MQLICKNNTYFRKYTLFTSFFRKNIVMSGKSTLHTLEYILFFVPLQRKINNIFLLCQETRKMPVV